MGPLQAQDKIELEKVRFARKTKLFMNAAGTAGVQGIVDPVDTYDLTQSRLGDRWTFTVKDAKGRAGALTFTLPGQIESFFVDPHDGNPGDADPPLYKEWRLSAPVAASGIFAPSAAGGAPKIRLILQGRGNSCTSADQLTSYSIVVSGPSASFMFFGPLVAPPPSP